MKPQGLACLVMLPLLAVGLFSIATGTESRFPELTPKALQSGEFMYRFDRYLTDGFAAREQLLDTKIRIGLLTGKEQTDDIILSEGELIRLIPEPDGTAVDNSIRSIQAFAQAHGGQEIYLMLIPSKSEIKKDTIKNQNGLWNEKRFIDHLYEALEGSVYPVDAYTPLMLNNEAYIFYRTDSRWTSLGAFLVFGELAGRLNITARNFDSFDIEYVTNNYRGELLRKTRFKDVKPDTIALYQYNYDIRFNKVVYRSGAQEVIDSNLYRYEYLEGANPYGVFLGDDFAVVDVITRRLSAKNLLVLGDDFANSLTPFLMPSYAKITMVNLQKLEEPLSQAVVLSDYDQVILLESMESFCTNAAFEKLLY